MKVDRWTMYRRKGQRKREKKTREGGGSREGNYGMFTHIWKLPGYPSIHYIHLSSIIYSSINLLSI